MKTPIEQEPIDCVGPDTTTDSIRRLEHLAFDPGTGEILRAGQTGETGTHDYDVACHKISTDPPDDPGLPALSASRVTTSVNQVRP